MQLALAIEKNKQQQRQLEEKDAEKAKAEQAMYDTGMKKTAQSLIAQLWDVARAFYAEVWGEALDVVGVNVDSKLREAEKIYYPQPLHIAPSLVPTPLDPSSTSSVPKLDVTSTFVISSKKEKEKKNQSLVVELRPEEVIGVEQ